MNEKNRASIGNVVGLPQCPGIEVTWTTQNPAIYTAPYQIKHHADKDFYKRNGLDPKRDECESDECNKSYGCEPGDLTKRMAVPWQADYYNCSVQSINFTEPDTNKVLDKDKKLMPKPPTYYTYWWPPQAPWNVISGSVTVKQQEASHDAEMAGLQINHARGINSYSQMVNLGWSHLGFIRNQNVGEYGQKFPYLVETEREHEMFDYKLVDYKDITHNDDDQEGQFVIISLRKVLERQ